MPDRANRTFICSVLFLDIVEYSKKPVSEQLKIKEKFNGRIADAIRDIAVTDRIILDTGDGVALNFLGDPEDALLVAMSLSQGFASAPEPEVEIRTGVNLGPVRLVRDINGQPNIIGDGINVAQRVTSFARPGQVLVSRSYYEAVTRVAEDYAHLFAYQGSRTDKHVREHEIYEVAAAASDALDLAKRRHRARPVGQVTGVDLAGSAEPAGRATGRTWLGNRALAYGAAAVSLAALLAAMVSSVSEPGDKPPAQTAKPAAPKQVELPEPPPPPVVIAAPPPPAVVAEAPPAVPAVSEPAKPPRPAAKRQDGGAAKPTRVVPKARKPVSHPAATRPARAEAKTTPALPAPTKAPVAEEPAPVSARAKAAVGPTALILLAVSPWGEVVVDGKPVGVAPPLSELELAPGRYRIEIRNSSFKPYLETFDLGPNETIRIKYKFKDG